MLHLSDLQYSATFDRGFLSVLFCINSFDFKYRLSSLNSTGTKIDPQQVEFETSGPSTSEVQQAKS